jgi:outer membrane murein-binding lipoprotein Lpp
MIAWEILRTIWKPLIVIIAFIAIVGTIYYQGYKSGGADCREDWARAEKERVEAINKKIDEIKTNSQEIAAKQAEADKKVIASIDLIIKKLKANIAKIGPSVVTYTTVENCKPNNNYVETWNEISKQANTK